VLTASVGYIFALRVPQWIGIDPKWGVAGLTASAGMAGWVEFALLRRALAERIGATELGADFLVKLWSVAFLGAGLCYVIKQLVGGVHPLFLALMVLPLYGAVYFGGSLFAGIQESQITLLPIMRRFRRRASR